jgi:hypothetical protein
VSADPAHQLFYGIAIFMDFNEGGNAVPHFHARYAGSAASIDFDSKPIAGAFRDVPWRVAERRRA